MKKVFVSAKDYHYLLDVDDIVYCKGCGVNAMFCLTNMENVIATKPITYYEPVLTAHKFLRIHRSYIVNTAFIQSVLKNNCQQLVLKNGEQLPLSSRRRKELMHFLNQIEHIQI